MTLKHKKRPNFTNSGKIRAFLLCEFGFKDKIQILLFWSFALWLNLMKR
jgi:hypothetical protein